MSRIVFFDLETGGFNSNRHPIIQIGAIAVESSSFEQVDEFECKLKFSPNDCDPQALKVNCYDADVWEEQAIEPLDACRQFNRFLKRFSNVEMMSKRTGKPYYVAQFAGFNADRFDRPFLTALYKQQDQFLPGAYRVIDVFYVAYWYFTAFNQIPPADFQLTTLAAHFDVLDDNAHDALADVRMTVAVYGEIMKRLAHK